MNEERPPLTQFRVLQWIEALQLVAEQYRLPTSPERAKLAARWQEHENDEGSIRHLARSTGLQVRFSDPEALPLTSWHLPVIAELSNGELALVKSISAANQASIMVIGEGGMTRPIDLAELTDRTVRFAIPRPGRAVPDARVDTYIQPHEEHWLRRILLRDARSYWGILVASLVTNMLALAGIIFSMQVYDRVVPAQSYPTLYILFFGVLLAIGFSFLLGRLRTTIIDVLGRRADLRISDRVFGHALRVRNRERPPSTGTFIAQLRDLEQVRELLTSTTVAAVADIPFFLLFLGVLWYIGGALALVPLAALILLLVPGILAQRRLRAYANEAMREGALRNAMLVEAVQRNDDIKSLQAEDRFQQQWNHFNAVTANAQLKLRGLSNSLTVWTQSVQNGVYAALVFIGAPLVMSGEMTTGALVGVSILGSRMMAPIAQITQVLNRLQQAKISISGIDQIMALPVDNPDQGHQIHAPAIAGGYDLRSAVFTYGDGNSPPALTVRDLKIEAGEKIALLGRNGAGKSTLLSGLSGLLQPVAGEVLLDGLALHHIDPADVRRDVCLLSQNSRLFHGTLRDNLTMGAPHASDQEIMAALAMVGADELVKRTRTGLEYVVQEGGTGLSGGQTQALMLARLLLREPSVVLLDEPTASMDEAAERHFIDRFREWSAGRTVIIATHRMRVLDLVDRIIVIQNAAVVLDQPKPTALLTMQKGKAA